MSWLFMVNLAVVGASLVLCVRARTWLVQVAALSLVGVGVMLVFLAYRAPDLLLTQFLIEVVSLLVLVLFFRKYRYASGHGSFQSVPVFFRAVLAVGMGAVIGGLLLMIGMAHAMREEIGSLFLRYTVPLAEGYNTVNTILVDFRGFDTMGEVTVLVIAMVGTIGLLWKAKIAQ